MHPRWVLSVLLVISLAVSPSRAQVDTASTGDVNAAAKQAAQAAAQEWLQHVDDGAWEAAWDASASGLRDTVAQEQWKQRSVRARDALGRVRSRKLVRARYYDTLPKAKSAGPFVSLRYRATFGPRLYVETVLAVQTDEVWRVAGYEVAPVAGRSRGVGSN